MVTIIGTRMRRGTRHYIVDAAGWIMQACTGETFRQYEYWKFEKNKHKVATCLLCHVETG